MQLPNSIFTKPGQFVRSFSKIEDFKNSLFGKVSPLACSTPGLQKSLHATLKAEMQNSEAKAKEQLSKDRKRRYLRSHWSMEAKCDSSSAKGRQSIAVLSDCCKPSDRFWVLYKERNVPLGTAQGKCPKYCDPG